MRVVVYPYTEAPIVLENVTSIEFEGGEDITIYDETEGRLPVNLEDVMKVELSK